MTNAATIDKKTVQVQGRAEREGEYSLEPVKLTMNLPEGCVENIKDLAAGAGIPYSHAVRRAVDFRHRIQKEIDAGAKILIERDGELMTIWFD